MVCERLKLIGFSSLKEYYVSSRWQATKDRMRASKFKQRCFCCRTIHNLNLHHKSYKTLGRENLCHLIWMCSQCHLETHQWVAKILQEKKIYNNRWGPSLWYLHGKVKRKYDKQFKKMSHQYIARRKKQREKYRAVLKRREARKLSQIRL